MDLFEEQKKPDSRSYDDLLNTLIAIIALLLLAVSVPVVVLMWKLAF